MGNTHSSILMFVEESPGLGLAAACTYSCGDAKLMMMVNLAVMAMARRIPRGL
jgi:hypothetical protein